MHRRCNPNVQGVQEHHHHNVALFDSHTVGIVSSPSHRFTAFVSLPAVHVKRCESQLLYTCCAFSMQTLLCSFFTPQGTAGDRRGPQGTAGDRRGPQGTAGDRRCIARIGNFILQSYSLKVGLHRRWIRHGLHSDAPQGITGAKDWRMCTFTPLHRRCIRCIRCNPNVVPKEWGDY